MRFKTKQLRKQWETPGLLHPKLVALVIAEDAYSQFHFGREIVVTSLVRKSNRSSVHYWGRGADIRSWTYTSAQVKELVGFAIWEFPYDKANYVSSIHHNIGRGVHIHLQVAS